MPRARAGFTLVEVLIVIVIIGVLAAIAIPKHSRTKERAYFTLMKSDLRNLATGQEAYYQLANAYYDGPVPAPGMSEYGPSKDVTITLSDVSITGWAATATHASVPGKTCAIYLGTAPPLPPATSPGQVACQ